MRIRLTTNHAKAVAKVIKNSELKMQNAKLFHLALTLVNSWGFYQGWEGREFREFRKIRKFRESLSSLNFLNSLNSLYYQPQTPKTI